MTYDFTPDIAVPLPSWLVREVNFRNAPLVPDLGVRKKELEKLVWDRPVLTIANELGISEVAVRKRCERLGVKRPPRGYWAKVHALELRAKRQAGITI